MISSLLNSFTNANTFKNLIQLGLEDNNIQRIEGLEALVNLKKLYLDKNCISRLEGLSQQKRLEELYLSKQRLPDFVEFTFDDERTLPVIGVR